MTRSGSSPRTSGAVRRRLAVAYALGGTAFALAVLELVATSDLNVRAVMLQVALLVPALCLQAPLQVGNRRIQVAAFADAAMILSLAVQPGPSVVVVATLVVCVRELRLQRPMTRVLFNMAAVSGPAYAAAEVQAMLAGPSLLQNAIALAAASLTVAALNEVAVAAVVGAVTGEGLFATLGDYIATSLIALAINLAIVGGVLGAIAGRRWELAVASPFVLIAVARSQKSRLLRATTSDALTRLQRAAEPIHTLDELMTASTVLDRAADLFGLEHVELVLHDWPDKGDRVHVRTGTGILRSATGAAPPAGANVLVVPLVIGAATELTRLGELRLGLAEPDALRPAEKQVLTTFVSTVTSSVNAVRSYAEQMHAARVDSLTGLPNRLALAERLDELRPTLLPWGPASDDGRTAPAEDVLAVLLLDLDHVKEVNDTLGHSAREAFLVEFGRRLRAETRPGDFVARVGGDEFAVLLRDIANSAAARTAAEALLSRLDGPLAVDGLELPMEASVGVSVAPRDGVAVDELLRCSDIAMYEAKAKRNGVVLYDPSMDPTDRAGLHLVAELQTAIAEEQLVVHYQPVVCLRTARTIGAEALVRWQHPVRGLLPPSRFVPVLERSSMIIPLTMYVLEKAVREALTWPEVGGLDLSLSVNLSARCLLAPSVPEQVRQILTRYGMPGRRLTLEITETLALADLEVVDDVLSRLRELGVRLSVDDFGTGYSSMSFLRKIAVHEVKVDRSFVTDAPTCPGDRAIVVGTVALAHGLGLTVVGEGVETTAQLRMLQRSGCDAAQGYLLGRPMPAEVFRRDLSQLHVDVVALIAASEQRNPLPVGTH